MQRTHEVDPDWPVSVSDDGCQIRDALKTLKKWGVCTDATWKYEIVNDRYFRAVPGSFDRPPSAAYNQAHKMKAMEYYRLDSFRNDIKDVEVTDDQKDKYGAELLEKVKHCLSDGYPVVFGFTLYEGVDPRTINDWDEINDIPGNLQDIPTTRKRWGAHAVLIIGYDDIRDSVLIQNSWGPKKCFSRFWMKYEWITDWSASNDFWTIRVLKPDSPPPPPKRHWTFTSIPGGTNTALGESSTVATVSRTQGTLEVMWIDQEGWVRGAYYYEKVGQKSTGRFENWAPFHQTLGRAKVGSGITAISCGPGRMQVFWIGEDGLVKSQKYLENIYSWTDDYIPTSGKKASQGITAVSRAPGCAEVWWKTENGGINGAYRYDTAEAEGQWTTYDFPPADALGSDNIVSLSRYPGHQEVWWTLSNGTIRNRSWEGDWKPSAKVPGPFATLASVVSNSRITVTARDKDNAALFYVTPSGKIRGAYWGSTSLPTWKEDLLVPSLESPKEEGKAAARSIARADCDLKAISFHPGQFDLVWVGPDCSLRAATIYPELESANGRRPTRFYTIRGSGMVASGSPMGIFRPQGESSFGILFANKDGALTLGYCSNPIQLEDLLLAK